MSPTSASPPLTWSPHAHLTCLWRRDAHRQDSSARDKLRALGLQPPPLRLAVASSSLIPGAEAGGPSLWGVVRGAAWLGLRRVGCGEGDPHWL